MADYILSLRFNTMLALWLYWSPMACCLILYFARSIRLYHRDLAERARETNYYEPSLTVGWILGKLLIAIIPAVNIFAVIFDVGPDFFDWLSSVFNIPLVPKRHK